VTTDDKQTREESDKNINKFNSLVVNNKADEQKSKYQSEFRGRVQDKSIRIDLEEPQFVLTYYEKTGRIYESIFYNKTINLFNDRMVLGWKLIMTNQEASLNEFQISAHRESINEFSSKIEKNENHADYFFGRGIDLMLVQDLSEALSNFDRAIEIDPSYTLAYFNRAVVRYKQIEYELANTNQDDFSETFNISLNTGRSTGVTSPAVNQQDNRAFMYDMIIRDYNTVIQQDPSFVYAYFNRAYLRCLLRDYRAAVSDYNEAIRRNANFAEAYFNRGLTQLKQGNTTSGITDLSKAGELGIIEAYSIIKRMTASN
jgi:tetratricopeptide (TPR) repeat protein